jgi:uncharacterized membrane protein YeaQ/YmgE (transglycosylase-associated protein family)
MSLLFLILFGFVVGLLARAFTPGDQKMGLVMTTLLGIGGSFMGGFLTSLITSQRVTDFNTAGIIGSLIGAILLLFLGGSLTRRRLWM